MGNSNKLLDGLGNLVRILSTTEKSYEVTAVKENNGYRKVIGFYSPSGGSGVTTVIVNTAVELSSRNLSVCVIDLNTIMPDVFRYLKTDIELEARKQSNSILKKLTVSGTPIPELIEHSNYRNIDIITGLFSEHPVSYIGGEDKGNEEVDIYISLVRELSGIYDYVLLDIPSDVCSSTVFASIEVADEIIGILDYNSKTLEYIGKFNQLFKNAGRSFISGIVLNKLKDGCHFSESDIISAVGLSVGLSERKAVICSLPFSFEIIREAVNGKVYMNTRNDTEKSGVTFRKNIRVLSDYIAATASDMGTIKRDNAGLDSFQLEVL